MSSVRDVVAMISGLTGGTVGPDTVDTVKLGDTASAATGVVTTFLATQAVLERAVEVGANLVVTHEPTFYGHRDDLDWLEGDPVASAKARFADEHGLVIWRFHDGVHAVRPDLIATALLDVLGLASDRLGDDQVLELDEVRLGDLASLARDRVPAPRTRLLGDPDLPVRRLAVRPGASGGVAQISALRHADALLAGEIAEWETPEYVRDSTALGVPRGAIVIGHQASEEPGMAALALRLARLLEVPVTHVPSGDPFA